MLRRYEHRRDFDLHRLEETTALDVVSPYSSTTRFSSRQAVSTSEPPTISLASLYNFSYKCLSPLSKKLHKKMLLAPLPRVALELCLDGLHKPAMAVLPRKSIPCNARLLNHEKSRPSLPQAQPSPDAHPQHLISPLNDGASRLCKLLSTELADARP